MPFMRVLLSGGASAVPAGGATHSAPGRLRTPPLRHYDWGARSSLEGACRSVKNCCKCSQTRPEAEPGVKPGECRGGAPRGERARSALRRQRRTCVARAAPEAPTSGNAWRCGAVSNAYAPVGAPPPSFYLPGGDRFVPCRDEDSDAPASRECVIASEAKQSRGGVHRLLDCFVASLLAMTGFTPTPR